MAQISISYWVAEAGKLNRMTEKRRISLPQLARKEHEIRESFLSGLIDYDAHPKEKAFILKAVLNSELVRMKKE